MTTTSCHIVSSRYVIYLPDNTAIKLTTLRAKTLADAAEQLPYTQVNCASTLQTKPVFPTSRPTYADVIRNDLVPRAEWMKAQPPYMSNEEADRTVDTFVACIP